MSELILISDTEESFQERLNEKLKDNFHPLYESFKVTLLAGNKEENEDQIILYSILMKR